MDARGATAVPNDPFWSAVRRRHPDINIVVLPDDGGPDEVEMPDAEPELVESVPAEFDVWVAEVWERLLPHVDCPPTDSRWTPGAPPGSLTRTALLAAEVDEVTALQALAGAARWLESDGFHVLAPPDGMPRVLAGRDEGAARRELQIVHVPATGRFAVSASFGPLVVGEAAAKQATGVGA
jgi:hypothetical protein